MTQVILLPISSSDKPTHSGLQHSAALCRATKRLAEAEGGVKTVFILAMRRQQELGYAGFKKD